MPRVPVPDDYEARDVPLPMDGDFSEASLRGYTGRVAQVRRDDEGRYVGVPEQLREAVHAFLHGDTTGENAPEAAVSESSTPESTGSSSEDAEADADGQDTEPGVCTATVERTGEECGRDLPCPYHSDADGNGGDGGG